MPSPTGTCTDDELLRRAGYPSVREQEEISREIIAAEQADAARTWRKQQLRLLSEAERKRGATADFDDRLGRWVADVAALRAGRTKPPVPAKFTYKCRCGLAVERVRRARNGGPIYCSARCKQAGQRRKPTSRVTEAPIWANESGGSVPESGKSDVPGRGTRVSVTPDPTERTDR